MCLKMVINRQTSHLINAFDGLLIIENIFMITVKTFELSMDMNTWVNYLLIPGIYKALFKYLFG